ncbi:MAG: hypothetical protein GXP63_01085 [DPANN group archaeon]|nr:hypothetical protein [DPANN group archaeon]
MAIAFIQELGAGARSLLGYLEFFMGGLFGLYLILVIIRWKESLSVVGLLKRINTNIEAIAHHLGVPQPENKTKLQKIKERLKKNGTSKKPQRRQSRRD